MLVLITGACLIQSPKHAGLTGFSSRVPAQLKMLGAVLPPFGLFPGLLKCAAVLAAPARRVLWLPVGCAGLVVIMR